METPQNNVWLLTNLNYDVSIDNLTLFHIFKSYNIKLLIIYINIFIFIKYVLCY